MYQGNNPIALQSQEWIVESLISLMEEIPYSQITIQRICKHADLSRQTFYNFFDSKEDVLHFCLREKYEMQFIRLESKTKISLRETVEAFADVLEKNRNLLLIMIHNKQESIITDEIAKCVTLFANHFGSKDDSYRPYAEALLSGALAHFLLCWLQQDNPISIDQLVDVLSSFLSGHLYSFVES